MDNKTQKKIQEIYTRLKDHEKGTNLYAKMTLESYDVALDDFFRELIINL